MSVFDVLTSEEVWTRAGDRPLRVWNIAFSPDGRYLAIARGNGAVRLRKSEDGAFVREFGDLAEDIPVAIAFSPNGQRVATATAHTAVSLWETGSGRHILSLSRSPGISAAIAFSPDGQAIVTGDVDGTVRLWPTLDCEACPRDAQE